jgi:hypothetical protein
MPAIRIARPVTAAAGGSPRKAIAFWRSRVGAVLAVAGEEDATEAPAEQLCH